jgi:hypothetical protein
MGLNLESTETHSWAYRHKNIKKELIKWYGLLQKSRGSERIEGQLTMLSSVLYLLLEPNEYKKLVTDKSLPTTNQINLL